MFGIFRISPVFALVACTTTAVLNPSVVESAMRNKGVYGVANFGDADPVKIKGKQPGDFDIHGTDVSRHNKAIDWKKAKKAGIEFVFVKATEGKDDRDVKFQKYWNGAARAGVERGAYHFYYFCAPPEAQARNYIRRVPKSQSSLPPVLDVEWNPESPTCRKRPPRAKTVDVLGRWLRMIEAHYGQKPIIYTTVDFYEHTFSGGALPGYQYWLRSVTAEPKYKYNRGWTFWQYSGTGLVPGMEDIVDLNAFKGNRAEWKAWLKANKR